MALRHDLCVFGNSVTYSRCRLARDRGRESGCWLPIQRALAQSQELVSQLKSEQNMEQMQHQNSMQKCLSLCFVLVEIKM